MKKIYFAALLLALMPIYSYAEEGCGDFNRQLNYLDQKEKDLLKDNGVIYSVNVPSYLPGVVISRRILPSCRARELASSYIDDKLSGSNKFMGDNEIDSQNRSAVATVVCAVVRGSSKGWPDGASHERFNSVSDDVFPDFFNCIYDYFEELGILNLGFFSPSAFLSPDENLVNAILDDRKEASAYSLDTTIMMLFVLRNGGREVEKCDAIKLMNSSKQIQYSNLGNKIFIEKVASMVSGENKITYDEARDLFTDLFFGTE